MYKLRLGKRWYDMSVYKVVIGSGVTLTHATSVIPMLYDSRQYSSWSDWINELEELC